MKKSTKRVATALLTAALMIMQVSPVYAADGETTGATGNFSENAGETEVNLVASTTAQGNLSVTVPLSVTLAVQADGTIVAPTNYKLANTGVIAAHVSAVSVALASPYTFNATPGENTLNLTLANSDETLTLQSGAQTLTANKWNLAGNAEMPLTFAGSVGNVNAGTSAQKIFTVSYTIQAGTAN